MERVSDCVQGVYKYWWRFPGRANAADFTVSKNQHPHDKSRLTWALFPTPALLALKCISDNMGQHHFI